MREIKFRVWIKQWQKILKISCIDWILGEIFIESDLHCYSFKIDEVELMQYAGLKDCKGREIYEGDILQYGLCVEVVFYEPTMGRFMTELKKCNDESEIGEISSLSPYYTDNYEVIGNIYENSELLK